MHKAKGGGKYGILPLLIYDPNIDDYKSAVRLSECMQRLLKRSPNGFSTFELYHELYKAPLGSQFDEHARHYDKIWLRPQRSQPETQTLRDRVFMNVTFTLEGYPDDGATNEIARALRDLPFVNYTRFEKIYDPRATLIRLVKLVVWMQRWCRKGRRRARRAKRSKERRLDIVKGF